MLSLKGTVPLRIRDVFPCTRLDCFGVSFLVLETSAVETSAFSRLVVLSVTNCPNYTHQLYRPPSGSVHLLEDGKLCAGCKQQWCPLLAVS